MPLPHPKQPRPAVRLIHHLARIALGGYLIYLGLAKAIDPVGFLKLLREYELLASPLPLNAAAALLPWFEVVCGVLLIAGIAVRGTALVVATLFLAFTAAIIHRTLAIHADLGTAFCAIRFDCGCGAGEVLACAKIPENLAWLTLAAWLLVSRLSPRKLLAWR